MHIPRDSYLGKLVARKHNGLVKVVTGVRRCGKSYLLFDIFRRHLLESGVAEGDIIAIHLDDRASRALRDPDACDAYVRSRAGGGRRYVLIDEVQMMPGFEDVLNGFLHVEGLDVYVTGSNSRFLSSDVITEFRGRGDEVRVHPLTFSEYYAAAGGDWDDAWGDYLAFGGMPHVLSLPSDRDRASYLVGLFRETYLRDIVERNGVRQESELEDLVRVIASSVGSLTNPRKIARTFESAGASRLSEPTVRAYLRYLEESFLVSRAMRYDVRGRRYISTPCKYYFEDVGLRNACLSFRQQEPTHLMENVVYNELVARGYQVDVGVVELSEAGRRKKVEIDFVANEGSRRYYVQSAFALPDAQKRAQEERPLLGTEDSFRKVIVVGGSAKPSFDERGVLTMGVKQFLLDPESLDA